MCFKACVFFKVFLFFVFKGLCFKVKEIKTEKYIVIENKKGKDREKVREQQ